MGGCNSVCLNIKEKDLDYTEDLDQQLKSNGQAKPMISHHIKNHKSELVEKFKDEELFNEPVQLIMKKLESTKYEKRKYSELQKDIIIDGSLLVGKASGNINENYKRLRKLGEGSYGTVYLVNHNYSNQSRAMKIITKKNTENNQIVDMEIINEIEILKKMDHPNIVKIFEFYNSTKNYYLITEFCKHGELFDKIVKEGPFNEEFTSYVMFQIFNAVFYCHSMNILHRDLKSENILIEREEKNGIKIKIIDFGTAKIFEKNKVERKIIGSSYYIAPEVLSKSYNEKCDLWSCGVIMYILLSSSPPFNGRNDNEIIENIKKGYYDLESSIWQKISNEAKHLIKNLLERNVGIRISAEEALDHKWFKKLKTKEKINYVEPEKIFKMLSQLKNYSPDKIMQHIALAYLVHNFPQNDEVRDAFKLFSIIDVNSNGKITKMELKLGISDLLKEKEFDLENLIDEIFSTIDGDNNGYIEYEEFVRGCIDKDNFITEDIIKFSFIFFDKDQNGEITCEEIKEILIKNFNKDVQSYEESIKNIIKEVDENKDGKISFEEFKKMMNSLLVR